MEYCLATVVLRADLLWSLILFPICWNTPRLSVSLYFLFSWERNLWRQGSSLYSLRYSLLCAVGFSVRIIVMQIHGVIKQLHLFTGLDTKMPNLSCGKGHESSWIPQSCRLPGVSCTPWLSRSPAISLSPQIASEVQGDSEERKKCCAQKKSFWIGMLKNCCVFVELGWYLNS